MIETRELSLTEDAEDAGKYELKARFVALRAKGLSYSKIARKLHVCKATLSNWSQELEAEIASLRAMELEGLQETYYLLKEGRIKLLGEQVKALREELKKRDLSALSTDKLLELLLRYYLELREEYVEARPLSEQEIQQLKDVS